MKQLWRLVKQLSSDALNGGERCPSLDDLRNESGPGRPRLTLVFRMWPLSVSTISSPIMDLSRRLSPTLPDLRCPGGSLVESVAVLLKVHLDGQPLPAPLVCLGCKGMYTLAMTSMLWHGFQMGGAVYVVPSLPAQLGAQPLAGHAALCHVFQ